MEGKMIKFLFNGGGGVIREIGLEVREMKKTLVGLRKGKNLLQFKPCRGDLELRQKDNALEEFEKRIQSLNEKMWKLERRRQEVKFAFAKPN
jgi:hypothetical protein